MGIYSASKSFSGFKESRTFWKDFIESMNACLFYCFLLTIAVFIAVFSEIIIVLILRGGVAFIFITVSLWNFIGLGINFVIKGCFFFCWWFFFCWLVWGLNEEILIIRNVILCWVVIMRRWWSFQWISFSSWYYWCTCLLLNEIFE